jgi:hypothetical protein
MASASPAFTACPTFCSCLNVCSKMVFVTSVEYDGNLGGLTGADAKCQALANAKGLNGTYLAWLSLSDGSASPLTRFTHPNVLYVLVDGTVVATNWNELISGNLQHAIDLDENGSAVAWALPWTNTRSNGSAIPGRASGGLNGDCTRWTSNASDEACLYPDSCTTAGTTGRADYGWTEYGNAQYCSMPHRFYCFQQ